MTIADNGKDAGKVPCCEYAKAETGLGEFELSIRECGNQTDLAFGGEEAGFAG